MLRGPRPRLRRLRQRAQVPPADDARLPPALPPARSKRPSALETVEQDAARRWPSGGMYDQVGGGFHRYSTDAVWLVPHFEKMLYDNALLARVYLDAWKLTGNAFYRRIVEETLDYVLREMTDAAGGFYSTRTPTPRAKRASSSSGRRPSSKRCLATTPKLVGAYFGVTRGRQLRGQQHPHVAACRQPRRFARHATAWTPGTTLASEPARTLRREARSSTRRASSASTPAATTRCSRPGTASCCAPSPKQRWPSTRQPTSTPPCATPTSCSPQMRPDGRLLRTWKAGRRARSTATSRTTPA